MDLIIVGAGGMGREVYSWLAQVIYGKGGYVIKGFIDDNPNALGNRSYPVDVIGSISEYTPNAEEQLILSILDPKVKKQIAESLIQKGAEFFPLIHPTAVIGKNVKLGKGTIICPYCILTNDIEMGDFVFMNTNSTIGHDSKIGDYTSINGKVEITGECKIGAVCLFGVGAKLIPGRKIVDGVTVGAGSVVVRNIVSPKTVFGNPAKSI